MYSPDEEGLFAGQHGYGCQFISFHLGYGTNI